MMVTCVGQSIGMISLTPLYVSSVHIFYLVHVVKIIIFQGRTCFMFIKTVVVTRFWISTHFQYSPIHETSDPLWLSRLAQWRIGTSPVLRKLDGSESWQKIYGGQQPNGQCDRKNVITFAVIFTKKLRLKISSIS